MKEEGNNSNVTIFVDTNVDTSFVFQIARNTTFGQLKEVLKCYHELCYPDMGKVGVQNLQVEANRCWYVVVDSTLVRAIFNSSTGFLKMNISGKTEDVHRFHERQTALEDVLNISAQNKALDHPVRGVTALQNASIEVAGGRKIESRCTTDPLKVIGESDGGLEELTVVAFYTQDGPVQTSCAGKDDIQGAMIGLQTSIEANTSNALNHPGLARHEGKTSTNVSDCGESQERISGKLFTGLNDKQNSLLEEPGSNALLQFSGDVALEVKVPPIIKPRPMHPQYCRSSEKMNTGLQDDKLQCMDTEHVQSLVENIGADSMRISFSNQMRFHHFKGSSYAAGANTQSRCNQGESERAGPHSNISAEIIREEAAVVHLFAATTGVIDQDVEQTKDNFFEHRNLENNLSHDLLGKSDTSSYAERVRKRLEPFEEVTVIAHSRRDEKLLRKDFSGEKNSGLSVGDHISVDVLSARTCSNMGEKQSMSNMSTDVDVDKVIDSLLSYHNMNPQILEDDKVSSCSISATPLEEKSFLKHVPWCNAFSKDMQELRTPVEKSIKYKKKMKRKLLIESSQKEERYDVFDIAKELEHMANGIGVKSGDDKKLEMTDDKQKPKKLKHRQSKQPSGGEVQEYLSRSNHGRGKIQDDKDGDALGQINCPEVTFEGDFSSDDMVGGPGKAFTGLTAHELGTHLAAVNGKAKADTIPQTSLDLMSSFVNVKKQKQNKTVHVDRLQEKPNTDILESASKDSKDSRSAASGVAALGQGHN